MKNGAWTKCVQSTAVTHGAGFSLSAARREGLKAWNFQRNKESNLGKMPPTPSLGTVPLFLRVRVKTQDSIITSLGRLAAVFSHAAHFGVSAILSLVSFTDVAA